MYKKKMWNWSLVEEFREKIDFVKSSNNNIRLINK